MGYIAHGVNTMSFLSDIVNTAKSVAAILTTRPDTFLGVEYGRSFSAGRTMLSGVALTGVGYGVYKAVDHAYSEGARISNNSANISNNSANISNNSANIEAQRGLLEAQASINERQSEFNEVALRTFEAQSNRLGKAESSVKTLASGQEALTKRVVGVEASVSSLRGEVQASELSWTERFAMLQNPVNDANDTTDVNDTTDTGDFDFVVDLEVEQP